MRRSLIKAARPLLAAAMVALAAWPSPALSETLYEALTSAYAGNPTLRAARAGQRATDEAVPQALSGWRPVITAQGSVAHQASKTIINGAADPKSVTDPATISIALSQPLFRGFKTVNGTAAAEATVEAGRQNLLAVEQDILFKAVQAYMNVIRDRRIVSLRQRNVGVLQQQARATQERLAAEDATRTDVAQARARVSAAQAELASARANLAASVANYQTIVGNKPGSLNYPRLAKLPGSLDGALGISQDVNPNILAAALVQEASEYTVEVVKGDLLPELSLQASASLTHEPSEGAESSRAGKIEGVLTIPLYEAGRVYSSVRKAKHEASQRKIQVIEASRAVRESVAASWAYLDAARQGIASAKTQVSAAQLALQGVREEYNIGSRTLLDVLNAEQEVLNAQIAQVSTERDQVVASYQVLAAMGKLTARNLSLRVDYYDPEENYLDVRDKWIGTGANTVE